MRIILLAFLAIAVNARVDTRCPPPSGLAGLCVITKDSCFPGQSCPEGRVCCPEGCGSVCKLPVKVPNPMCPANQVVGPCVVTKNNCFRDEECDQGFYCCPDGCGSKCVKPGCPIIKFNPNIRPVCALPIVPPCKVDGDCYRGEICCPGICYNRCIKSALPEITKPGTCPSLPNPLPQCLIFQNDCKSDNDCPANKKCCSVACGIGCSEPILCPPVCLIACPFGNVLDENGCPTCQCKETPCRYNALPVRDTSGQFLNCGRGGTSCIQGTSCNIDPTDRFAVCCPDCSPVLCKLFCPFGFKVDKNGCEYCSCKETPCRYNALPVRDTSGQFLNCGRGGTSCIQGTSCNIDPTDRFAVCCPDCPPVLCKLFCPFGFKVDKNGCEYCSCKETPCRYNALPVRDTSGQFLNCGRGGTSCIQGTSCNTDPTDRFAVCCPDCRSICSRLCIYGFKLVNNCPTCECKETPCRNGLPPLKTTLGTTVTCDRDGAVASCPEVSTCRADDYGNYAVCCPNSSILPRKFGCPTPPSRFLVRCNTQNNKCNSNKDCPGGQSCCNNPCGRYCTDPVPIKDGFCPAQPDPSLVYCGSLSDRCHLDSDCPDLEKCCSTACGNVCQSPMSNPAENPGVCQLQDANAFCSNFRNNRKCNADVECPLYEKCCETKCGKFCLTSEALVVNPGICPSPDRRLNCLYYNKQCNQDGNCPSGQKCCEDNCGTSCKLPMYKPGVCPAPRDPAVVLCPVGSTNECITDPDCPGDNKCCDDPCGKRCDLVRPKPGICPVPPDPSAVLCSIDSKDECSNDRDCPLDLKCCDNPCGKRCDLVRPKPGICPVPPDPSVVLCSIDSKDECSNDRDCPLDLKCCNNPCGTRCDLVRPKPGVCPVPPDPSVVFCFDSKDECSNDRDCPLDLKCCNNPCGKRCDLVKPKPGVCPVPPDPSVVLCPIDSKDECSNDRECPLDQKCCDDPCGKRCDLVIPKQGKCPIDVLLPCPISNECLVDRDCYGNDVCCSAIGCPRTCVDPAIGGIRPGLCPVPRDPAVVLCPVGSTNECITDPDCPGDNKCCDDPCGKRCDLVRPKPGSCPASGFQIISDVQCHHSECKYDHECELDLKCCSTFCGYRCITPTSDLTSQSSVLSKSDVDHELSESEESTESGES